MEYSLRFEDCQGRRCSIVHPWPRADPAYAHHAGSSLREPLPGGGAGELSKAGFGEGLLRQGRAFSSVLRVLSHSGQEG